MTGVMSTQSPGCPNMPPVVFVFTGLSGDDKELAALRAGCQPALQFVQIDLPHWFDIYNKAIALDAVIAASLAQIEAHDPNTPALLAGYSFGGHIAFTVATALEAAGRRVGRLGLLDTSATPPLSDERFSALRSLKNLRDAIRKGRFPAQIGHNVAGIAMRSGYRWPLHVLAGIRHVRLPMGMQKHIDIALQMRFNLVILKDLLDRMSAPGTPRQLDATLFRCTEQAPGSAEDLQWRRHLANLQIVAIPGNHLSLMNPRNIPALCTAFINAMTQAASPHNSADTKLMSVRP